MYSTPMSVIPTVAVAHIDLYVIDFFCNCSCVENHRRFVVVENVVVMLTERKYSIFVYKTYTNRVFVVVFETRHDL